MQKNIIGLKKLKHKKRKKMEEEKREKTGNFHRTAKAQCRGRGL